MVAFWDKLKFVKKPFGSKKPAAVTSEKPSSTVVADVVVPAGGPTGDAYRVLVRPVVSEKAAHLSDDGQYCFEVAPGASSGTIAAAFQKVYGIAPARINIIRRAGVATRFGRTAGRTKDVKKAIITLPPGKRIKLFEGV